jgi:DNA repair protein RAD57
MYESHPLLSPKTCGLAEVRTLKAETIPKLLLVLNQHLPELVQRLSKDATSKPVKLIVIDALAELFHSADKTSTMTLVERSRGISHVSNLLHILASKHHIAVLVLNEVTDVFDHGVAKDVVSSGDVLYREQVRWFGRADSIPGEDRKEAALGLVWANQVNARIMLTRTNRRRYLDDVDDRTGKRRRLESGAHAAARDLVPEASHIRRLSVVFSSVCSPTSLDYVVTIAGIFVVPEESSSSHSGQVQAIAPVQQPLAPKGEKSRTEISPLDEGCVQDELTASQSAEAETDIEWTDDDTEYWKGDVELDAIYSTVDLDLLCMHNTGSRS